MSELEKHAATTEQRDTVLAFLDWVQAKKWCLAHIPPEYDHTLVPAPISSFEQLVQEFLGIDPAQLERERRELLNGLG